jgi:hypothetical protein
MNHNKEYSKTNLSMPVLAVGGDGSFGRRLLDGA